MLLLVSKMLYDSVCVMHRLRGHVTMWTQNKGQSHELHFSFQQFLSFLSANVPCNTVTSEALGIEVEKVANHILPFNQPTNKFPNVLNVVFAFVKFCVCVCVGVGVGGYKNDPNVYTERESM